MSSIKAIGPLFVPQKPRRMDSRRLEDVIANREKGHGQRQHPRQEKQARAPTGPVSEFLEPAVQDEIRDRLGGKISGQYPTEERLGLKPHDLAGRRAQDFADSRFFSPLSYSNFLFLVVCDNFPIGLLKRAGLKKE